MKQNLEEIKKQRKKLASRRRRIIFHSDGKPWDDHRLTFPHLPGTQTDACTFSLMHQFNLSRHYRTKVAQEWPPGDLQERYGDGPDNLHKYIDFCQERL